MDNADEVNGQRLYNGKEAYLLIIFSRWRKLHLISLFVALLSAFTACFTFFVYNNKFYPNCPLYAKLVISKVQGNDLIYEIVVKGDEGKVTEWGHENACRSVLYVLLINILTAIAGILLFCIRGNFSPNSDTKLVPSTCICGIMVTVLSFSGAIVVTRGGSIFCDSFKNTELEKCETAQFVRWTNFPQIEGFYDYLMRSQIAFWLTTHTWFFHSIMALIRWVTNADYVIAEERELREKPLEVFTITSADRQTSTDVTDDEGHQTDFTESEETDSEYRESVERRICEHLAGM